jgi:hypothetical protein
MYKDPDKQREANRIAARARRDRAKGITQNVTPDPPASYPDAKTVIPSHPNVIPDKVSVIPSVIPCPDCLSKDKEIKRLKATIAMMEAAAPKAPSVQAEPKKNSCYRLGPVDWRR